MTQIRGWCCTRIRDNHSLTIRVIHEYALTLVHHCPNLVPYCQCSGVYSIYCFDLLLDCTCVPTRSLNLLINNDQLSPLGCIEPLLGYYGYYCYCPHPYTINSYLYCRLIVAHHRHHQVNKILQIQRRNEPDYSRICPRPFCGPCRGYLLPGQLQLSYLPWPTHICE